LRRPYPVIPLINAGIATAGGTLSTNGRLIRWLPETGPPPRALAATIAIVMVCMIINLTMFTMIMVSGVPTKTVNDHRLGRPCHSHSLPHRDRRRDNLIAMLFDQIRALA
jgi:hypothetical protein